MRERLFDYHQRINRERRERTEENRRSIDMLRIRARIGELDAKIEAATGSIAPQPSPRTKALEAMLDKRKASRAAVENSAAITPEVRQAWSNRLDAIYSSASEKNPTLIRRLAAEVDGLAEEVLRISENLAGAASKRILARMLRFPLSWSRVAGFTISYPDILPVVRTPPAAGFGTEPLARPVTPPFGLAHPQRGLLADDLHAIHDQIVAAQSVSGELRKTWLDQLGMIDSVGGGLAAICTSVERAEKLTSEIRAVQSDLEAISISLRDYARSYQAWWDD